MAHLEAEVAAAAHGDVAAFRAIVVATSARLVRLAARIVGSVEDGEDVVQEAYMKAHRALGEGRFDGKSSVETWLYRIVANGAIDALRAGRKRHRESTTDTVAEPSWDGGAAAEARVALAELDELLSTLPPEQRVAFVLKTIEGRTSSEIAEFLGTTEGAVEQRLVRARATLAAWSERDG